MTETLRRFRTSAAGLLLIASPMICLAATVPADLPRAEICLNGTWDTAIDVEGGGIPAVGWTPRRAPALPLAGKTPVTSIWYRHRLRIPREWVRPGRQFLLRVEKAGHYAAVYWNGRITGEHYGQFTPFDSDVTGAIRGGETNEIAIYVHNASDKYVRPGAVITDPVVANAYRAATDIPYERNWTGLAGDITLHWRPAAHIAGVFVIPSVRNKKLEVRVETAGASGLTIRSAVLDRGKAVLRLPGIAAATAGVSTVQAGWSNPVLWGPEPYGEPKLYVLRTELIDKGKVVDRKFTRFGFREVWISGRDVLLNGKKLWMAGTYFGKLAPVRYLNDRRPQLLVLDVMAASGLNTLHGHWDELGESWLNACDEKGMLVLGAFYCDGRPQIQSRADEGWNEWIVETGREWVRSVRHHPSIVIWRPMDAVMPPQAKRAQVTSKLMAWVRREDGTRPLAVEDDDSDITAWNQSSLWKLGDLAGGYDDGAAMARKLAASRKPFLTKEIYGGFQDVPNLSQFFRMFYEKSYAGGSTGVIVQHLPLARQEKPFRVTWLSDSGPGNRDTLNGSPRQAPPNWCDPSAPAWTPTPYSELFAELYRNFTRRNPAPAGAVTAPELLASGLAPDDFAMLLPRDLALAPASGVRAAADGTAWLAAAQPGEYDLVYSGGSRRMRLPAQALPRKPGYDYVRRIAVGGKPK